MLGRLAAAKTLLSAAFILGCGAPSPVEPPTCDDSKRPQGRLPDSHAIASWDANPAERSESASPATGAPGDTIGSAEDERPGRPGARTRPGAMLVACGDLVVY